MSEPARREYIVHTRTWSHALDGESRAVYERINVSGPSWEFGISFYDFTEQYSTGAKIAVQVAVFSDAWQAFAECDRLFAALADVSTCADGDDSLYPWTDRNSAVDWAVGLLEAHGFVDSGGRYRVTPPISVEDPIAAVIRSLDRGTSPAEIATALHQEFPDGIRWDTP